ncbi:MAG TPA: DUF4416 family protein [Sumerlaeia bacterium]|nr:DUF4416 family protein [Sumerlaeia bacterium]
MGRRNEDPPRVKLFVALMAQPGDLFQECEARLAAEFGPVDARGEFYSADAYTQYYAQEFGENLVKCIVSLGKLAPPEQLVDVKIRANAIEDFFARKADPLADAPPRIINIDPGYLNCSKVVLATTKDHAHRLYMGRGVFEEVTLSFLRKERGFQPHPWTYPDYRAPERLDFFNRLREIYRRQLRSENAPSAGNGAQVEKDPNPRG